MGDFDGKVILVTGGSRGIGAAITRQLVAGGGEVVIHYSHHSRRAEALADELGPARCHLVQADFTDPASALDAWRAAVEWRGHIDVLVNNAGIYASAGVDDDFAHWAETWRRTLDINLVATAHLCREAIKHFRTRGGGTIVNIASRAAFRGDDVDNTHYAASKGGMVALTRTIARGHAAEGILAYVVAPGFVRTEMAEQVFAEEGEARVLGEIPLGEIPGPEDVAEVVAFLASGRARFATGTTVDVNGASYVR